MKMMIRNALWIMALGVIFIPLVSCVNRKSEQAIEVGDLSDKYKGMAVSDLKAVDTIYSFTEDFPVEIRDAGDKMVLVFAKQDTELQILDKEKRVVTPVAVAGNGPDDVNSPSFFQNNYITDDGKVGLYDLNRNELVFVSADSATISKKPLPDMLVRESCVNYFGNEAVSYAVMKTDNFFKISDLKANSSKDIPYPYKLSEESWEKIKSLPGYLAPIIYADKKKNRIILAQYYFDMYSVYDMEGNFIKSVSLSDENFDVDSAIDSYYALDENGYIRYAPGAVSDEFVYLKRMKMVPDLKAQKYNKVENSIVKLDWDGNPPEIIVVPEGLGGFCIDKDGNIIAIVNSADEDGKDTESYHIVRYAVGR